MGFWDWAKKAGSFMLGGQPQGGGYGYPTLPNQFGAPPVGPPMGGQPNLPNPFATPTGIGMEPVNPQLTPQVPSAGSLGGGGGMTDFERHMQKLGWVNTGANIIGGILTGRKEGKLMDLAADEKERQLQREKERHEALKRAAPNIYRSLKTRY